MASKILFVLLFIILISILSPVTADTSQITLNPGWNFISVPNYLADGYNTGIIFNGINQDSHSIFSYSALEKRWIRIENNTLIEPLSGLWVYSKSVATVPVTYSSSPTALSKNLVRGWNSFGFPDEEQSAASALTSIKPQWTQIIGYNSINQQYETAIIKGGSGAYSDTRTVDPGKGYWIYTSDNCTFIAKTPDLSRNLTVSIIDFGQGDSILVESPNDDTMLIDAGPTEAGTVVTAYLKKRNHTNLEYLVISHPHEDHIGGMPDVINAISVSNILDIGYAYPTKTYENLLNLIDQENIPYRVVNISSTIAFDPDVAIQILNPSKLGNDADENGLVLRMTYGSISFLFPADVGFATENKMLASGKDISADILKVGHHGSKYSSSLTFLSTVHPSASIISVGAKNSYGHPAPETIHSLNQIGSRIFRTDTDGDVLVTTDGNHYTIITEKGATYYK